MKNETIMIRVPAPFADLIDKVREVKGAYTRSDAVWHLYGAIKDSREVKDLLGAPADPVKEAAVGQESGGRDLPRERVRAQIRG